jgi:predicted ArsR family transcriptional regulator
MSTPGSSSPAQLIAHLSRLMQRFPAYASYLRTARDAVIGTQSTDGVHGIILGALAEGAATYHDLQTATGFSSSYLRRHLDQLIQSGQVYRTEEPGGYQQKPRKLHFLTKKMSEHRDR